MERCGEDLLDSNLDSGRKAVGTNDSELIWTPEMVRRFWTHQRTRPEEYFSFQVGKVLVRRFRRYLQGRVVDYGAGPGFLVDEFLAAGIQCGAVEFGEEASKELNDRFNKRRGFLGARTSDRLAEWKGTFDAALLIEVVEHLYDRELHECLSCVHSLLKSGGCLIVTTPNEEDRSRSFICSPESGLLFHRYQHVRSWDPSRSRTCLARADLESIRSGRLILTRTHMRRTEQCRCRSGCCEAGQNGCESDTAFVCGGRQGMIVASFSYWSIWRRARPSGP